jgi:predicted RNase H-like nuclease (RuvC/YqgF family)
MKPAEERLTDLHALRSRLLNRIAELKFEIMRCENELARVELEMRKNASHLQRFMSARNKHIILEP